MTRLIVPLTRRAAADRVGLSRESKTNIGECGSAIVDFEQAVAEANMDKRQAMIVLPEARCAWDEKGDTKVRRSG